MRQATAMTAHCSSFNPKSHFVNGEQGFLSPDFSGFSNLFQDSAGTIPVTAFEQPVGKVIDISGRGNHWYQPSNPSRPVVSARYNKAVATDTLSTQAVTTLSASYKIYFTGTGSVTLSGTATGTLVAGTNTITATAGTLTITVTGSVLTFDIRESNDGVGLPVYQRVTSSIDYDTVGFPAYLAIDGIDDFMLTNTIDCTDTNKMTIFAGVRKLSDAARGIVIEFNSTSNGSFNFDFPNYTSGPSRTASRGTIEAATTIAAYTAPASKIFTITANIAQPFIGISVNGTDNNSSTTTQGTGTYSNAVAYLFSRAGTSIFFKGRCYYLEMRAAQTTNQSIAQTNIYINRRSKIY